MFPTPAIGAAEVAVDLPPERVHFRELLLADHFKDLIGAEADAPPSGDTTFEQLEYIGYQPQLKQLNAVIELKQSSGYSGGICTGGSTDPDDDKKTAELKAEPERCVDSVVTPQRDARRAPPPSVTLAQSRQSRRKTSSAGCSRVSAARHNATRPRCLPAPSAVLDVGEAGPNA